MAGDTAPWTVPSAEIDPRTVRMWREWTDDARHPRTPIQGPDSVLRPGITVVIPTFGGRDRIGVCLESLAGQTLDAEAYELIVIHNGPDDGTGAVVEEFRVRSGIDVRLIRMARPGASRARNAGIAAASRAYTTFVDDDDHVSPSFLETLLAYADRRVIAATMLVDDLDGELDADTHINQMLRSCEQRHVEPAQLGIAVSYNAAKAVATDLIKAVRYDEDLASGEDIAFWAEVVSLGALSLFVCPESAQAAYYRRRRPDSVSRAKGTFDFLVSQRIAVIARLDALLPEARGHYAKLIRRLMDAQAKFINGYLRANPAEHPRVVEAVDHSGIARFPYGAMNSGLGRDLAVAYAFPPFADTSAVVAAKRIRQTGRIVDVVSNDLGRVRKTDESLRRIAGPFTAREATVSATAAFANWAGWEAYARDGLKAVRRWTAESGAYHRVYSRAQFAASHLLAALVKLEFPETEWTAEFSDPLSRDIHNVPRPTQIPATPMVTKLRAALDRLGLAAPSSASAFQWLEEIPYLLADRLVFTNPNQLEHMLSYADPAVVDSVRAKAVVAPHPTLDRHLYDIAPSPYALDPKLVNLAYFGNFYETRGLDDLLTAIAQSGADVRDRIRLHVFTSKPQPLAEAAEQLGIAAHVAAGPYVGFLEFLNLTTRFDCLIVNDASTRDSHAVNPYLPSKWSDYRGSGTPVWGIVELGSPLSGQPLDHLTEIGDVAAAGEVLKELARHSSASQAPTVAASDRSIAV